MKKIVFLLLTLSFFMACTEDEMIDITVMPEETTYGANTFGCLIEGWLYVGGRYHFADEKSIQFSYITQPDTTPLMKVSVMVKRGSFLQFDIQNPEEGKETVYRDVYLQSRSLPDGKVYITRFDKTNKILSGRFSGGEVTEGRFDVIYEE